LNSALHRTGERLLVPRDCRLETFRGIAARVANLEIKNAVGVRRDEAYLTQLIFKAALRQQAPIPIERVSLAGGVQVA